MSVDIDWDTLTTGPSGLELAESIRHFIHDKFQQIALPRFIRSVEVHSFAFGAQPPTITLKDLCDPFPEFYDSDDSDAAASSSSSSSSSFAIPPSAGAASPTHAAHAPPAAVAIAVAGAPPTSSLRTRRESQNRRHATAAAIFTDGPSLAASPRPPPLSLAGSFARAGTPGIPGGTSNLSYFHLPLGAGIGGPGVSTPLAAVSAAWAERRSGADVSGMEAELSSRPSTARSRTSWEEGVPMAAPAAEEGDEKAKSTQGGTTPPPQQQQQQQQKARPEAGPADLQVVLRVRYAGDVRLALTTEILLDYPMPSFVGIPLTLNVTGLRFDGVALLAYLRSRAHFCFLGPEDAEMLIGAEGDGEDDDEEDDDDDDDDEQEDEQVDWELGGQERKEEEEGEGEEKGKEERKRKKRRKKYQRRRGPDDVLGGLLQEIRIESEIGQKEGGKQVLKNVGKVEKFVLEQVRRIFEDEFVWPSYYTFLV